MFRFIYKLIPNWFKICYYKIMGGRPWSKGYSTFKFEYIKKALCDKELMKKFKNFEPLPKGYGYALDSRVVEYPWVLSRISTLEEGNILDAGSVLNFKEILESKVFKNKKITIATLSPEPDCFWQKGISYVFGDIRNLLFKDNCFDYIICISTLEHVGMDNVLYAKDLKYREEKIFDFGKAILELKRILKKNGNLFITVPFGKYQNFGWFQQFNSEMVSRTLEIFQPQNYQIDYYKYTKKGWNISDEASCRNSETFDVYKTKYFNKKSSLDFDPDFAASSRAVACIKLIK